MNRNPVLVILNGAAATLGLILVATNVLHVTNLEPEQVAAVTAAVAGVANLVGVAIRQAVTPNGTVEQKVLEAWLVPSPVQPSSEPQTPVTVQ